MTVKDLYRKYNNYSIMLFGKPLEQKTIPFSFLPTGHKELMNYIIKDVKIVEKEHDEHRFSFSDLRFKETLKLKGYVYAYCIKE